MCSRYCTEKTEAGEFPKETACLNETNGLVETIKWERGVIFIPGSLQDRCPLGRMVLCAVLHQGIGEGCGSHGCRQVLC